MHRLTVFATSFLGAGFLGWAVFRNLYPKKKYFVPVNEWGEPIGQSDALECWWSLSYAHWLTVPRVAMKSMPTEWQDKMAALLEELDDRIDWRPEDGIYWVSFRKDDGRFAALPEIGNYRHDRMQLKPPIKKATKGERKALE